MKSINFNSGIREYAINGDESNVIRVPLDLNIMDRMVRIGSEVAEIAKQYASKKPTPADFAQFDARVREKLNEAFGTDICTPAFGNINCLSPVDADGTMLFQAFFDAFLPQFKADLEAAFPKQQKAAAPTISPKAQQYISTAPSAAPVAALANPYGNVPDVSGMSKEQKLQLMAQLMQG